jgi:hypothetical protein
LVVALAPHGGIGRQVLSIDRKAQDARQRRPLPAQAARRLANITPAPLTGFMRVVPPARETPIAGLH